MDEMAQTRAWGWPFLATWFPGDRFLATHSEHSLLPDTWPLGGWIYKRGAEWPLQTVGTTEIQLIAGTEGELRASLRYLCIMGIAKLNGVILPKQYFSVPSQCCSLMSATVAECFRRGLQRRVDPVHTPVLRLGICRKGVA